MQNHLENPWKTLKSELVYESPWIAINKHDVLNPAGNSATYSVVNFKNLAIGILPLDENLNTWLVGQYRYPTNEYSWEIPEGGGKFTDTPVETAARELKEETGIVAKEFTELMRMHLSNSATDELAIVYIAQGLSFEDSEPEESEVLQVKKIHINDVFDLVMKGEIKDGITVAAVLKIKYLIDNNLLT